MKFKTIQASAFKATFEVLKDILNDINVYFDSNGMKIVTLDTARTSLIDLELTSDNFEHYECSAPIIAGINMTNLHKLLKTITNNDTLECEIKNNEFMNIHISNTVKTSSTHFQLKLLDVDEDQIELPNIEMNTITILPSIDFQRICRDMSHISNELIVTRSEKNIFFKCEGDFANQQTQIEVSEKTDTPITGIYSLKYLNLFTKATGMCSNIQIMQEPENKFMILKYNVANLGNLSFYLASKVID